MSTTFANGQTGLAPTIESIAKAAEEFARIAAEHEPLAELMRSKGFDPKDGCLLLLPLEWSARMPFPPKYVRFHPWADAPTMIRPPAGYIGQRMAGAFFPR